MAPALEERIMPKDVTRCWEGDDGDVEILCGESGRPYAALGETFGDPALRGAVTY